MKTLILTCNTGQGHNATAAALRECLLQRGDTCDVTDALIFLSGSTSEVIGKMHVRIYRHAPRVFSVGYRMAEEHPRAFRRRTPLWRALTAGSRRIYHYLIEGGYDTVICTHAFSALMLTAVLERYPSLQLRSCFVATDYTCSPSVSESDLDEYIIPDDSLADEFAACGVPRERLRGLGIPVRAAFARRGDKALAKARVGIPVDGKHLVMMCGSMGCGPMEKITDLLAASMPADVTVSVVCGTNAALQKKLEKKYTDVPSLRILGFVDDVPLLMDSADLYLTKPGGISVSEATAKRLPMVLIDAVAGCEDHNLRYFLERGMACTESTPEALVRRCLSLLSDEASLLQSMAAAMEKYDHADAAQKVCALLSDPCARGRGELGA
ncbi:MAG: glycosyltransferase [Clostridia bacterium]|nr:glycosyltransferase [Clostridia bacterium]